MIAVKVAAMKFLPRYIAFFDRIPIKSLKIRNSKAMHLGKNSSPPSLVQSFIGARKSELGK